MIPARIKFVLAGIGILWVCLPVCVTSTYTDITDHSYDTSILYLTARGVVKGYPDGSFRPDQSLTRAEMLKIVLKPQLQGELMTGKEVVNCFSDVMSGAWFAPYVCLAKQQQIVRGYPDGRFGPEQSVTIAEGLKIAFEAYNYPISEGVGGDWYQPYIDYVHTHNLFSKYAMRPDVEMNRGQMAYLIHQLLLEQEGAIDFTAGRDSRSLGCFQPQPIDPPPGALIVSDEKRPIMTVVGEAYDHDSPSRLIVAFHGRTNDYQMVRRYYGLEKVRDEQDIIVYPTGRPPDGPTRNRSRPGEAIEELRDIELFDQIVEQLADQYCIDLDQIYVVGHSLGARFANSLACARGDVIRGVASVGGSATLGACTGPVAALMMHHPDDRLSPFVTGERARDQVVRQNGCSTHSVPSDPESFNCRSYTACIDDAPLIWCPHSDSLGRDGRYYPHTWPDGAGQAVREFIEQQSHGG